MPRCKIEGQFCHMVYIAEDIYIACGNQNQIVYAVFQNYRDAVNIRRFKIITMPLRSCNYSRRYTCIGYSSV